MKKFLAACGLVFLPLFVFAQAAELPAVDFFTQLMETVKGFGGFTGVGKISAVIVLLIASMKVSFLNQMLWSKLGKIQAAVAPVLGLIGGILMAGMNGKLPTPAEAMVYISAGVGAIFLHEVLDLIKMTPGIGPMWVSLINLIEGFLGKK